MSENVKDIVEQIAAEAEATMDEPMPEGTVWKRPNRAKSATFSLRLNPEEVAAVQDLAREHGVSASALVRGWIVQRLTVDGNAPTDTAAMVDRLEADVRTLRKLVAS